MSNFIRQNEVNMANELLKVQQPLLESSSEMDKLLCISHKSYCDGDKFSFSRILNDREYQLPDPWSAKSPKMQYIGSLEAALQKNIFLQKSVKKICTIL